MPDVEEFQKGKFVDPLGILRMPPRTFVGKPQTIDDEHFDPVGVCLKKRDGNRETGRWEQRNGKMGRRECEEESAKKRDGVKRGNEG
jgi:hypothetical protein